MGRENRKGVFELPQDPKLEDLFKILSRAVSIDINCRVPATVLAFNPETNKAQVQVDNLEVVVDPNVEPTRNNPNPCKTLPPRTFVDIPVRWDRTNAGHFTLPLNPGDTGELAVHDRSLQKWLEVGTAADPVSSFIHMLGDSVFIPGLKANGTPFSVDQTAAVVEGPLVKLGAGAVPVTEGVARLGDQTRLTVEHIAFLNLLGKVWNDAVAAGGGPLLLTPAELIPQPPFTGNGTVVSASTKVAAE